MKKLARMALFVIAMSVVSISLVGCDAQQVQSFIEKVVDIIQQIGSAITGGGGGGGGGGNTGGDDGGTDISGGNDGSTTSTPTGTSTPTSTGTGTTTGTNTGTTGAKVVIFGSSSCHFCTEAKQYFQSKGIPYDYIDVNQNQSMYEAIKKKGAEQGVKVSGVPVIVINGKIISGFDKPEIESALKAAGPTTTTTTTTSTTTSTTTATNPTSTGTTTTSNTPISGSQDGKGAPTLMIAPTVGGVEGNSSEENP